MAGTHVRAVVNPREGVSVRTADLGAESVYLACQGHVDSICGFLRQQQSSHSFREREVRDHRFT